MKKKSTLHKRADSWNNLITGLGTNQDKRMAGQAQWDHHSQEFYEQAYAGDSLSARIVDIIPEECMRKWIHWTDCRRELADARDKRCEQLGLRGAMTNAWKWGRAYGGACLHIVTETDDPSQPLRRGENVIGLRDLSRWDLRILTTDVEYDFGSPNWGCPRLYYLNVQMGSQFKGYPIHWTRMIRFDGQLVPRRTYIRNNYWHDSILNRLFNSIRNYQTSNDAAAACLQDFNVDVYKMKDLANLVASGQEAIVKKRIELIQFSKSILRAMILDTDQEEYENKGRSLEGVAELLVHQANRLVADTDIPHTKLLGESPDGSNATGNSTSQQFYDYLHSEQENYARPKLQRLMGLVFPEEAEDQINWKWNALRVLDEVEQADVRNKQSITDRNYVEIGALDPTEVANSRFGGSEYSLETDLDHEARASGTIAPGSAGMEDLSAVPPQEGEGAEPGPSEKNPMPMRGQEGSGRDLTGRESPEAQKPGTQYEPRHETIFPVKNPIEKTRAFISQTMSEPMRDPKTDPHIKGPGIPNKARTFLPTRGTGVVAPSGYDMQKDKPGNAEYTRESGGAVNRPNKNGRK